MRPPVPNPANVTAPINIHGIGRSGTTLLQNILGISGFIQMCNETNDFVCGCYRAGELLNPTHDRQAAGGIGAWTTRALHAALCAALPSDKPSWCQKMIGIPKAIVWDQLISEEDLAFAAQPCPFPYQWYWNILSQAFPYGIDILMLRDYRDVIVSRNLLSNWSPEEIAKDIAIHYNLMAHPASHVGRVIRFEQLVAAPADVIFTLCNHLGITYSDAFLEGMNWYAVPSPGRRLDEARATNFTWRMHHQDIVTEQMHQTIAPALERLTARFALDATISAEAPVDQAA